jgi:hypothetical protein
VHPAKAKVVRDVITHEIGVAHGRVNRS